MITVYTLREALADDLFVNMLADHQEHLMEDENFKIIFANYHVIKAGRMQYLGNQQYRLIRGKTEGDE